MTFSDVPSLMCKPTHCLSDPLATKFVILFSRFIPTLTLMTAQGSDTCSSSNTIKSLRLLKMA